MRRKTVSIVIPTFNEEENVVEISDAIINVLKDEKYKYELIFIDNLSQDYTRLKLSRLCQDNKHIKAIFNASNFG